MWNKKFTNPKSCWFHNLIVLKILGKCHFDGALWKVTNKIVCYKEEGGESCLLSSLGHNESCESKLTHGLSMHQYSNFKMY